MQIFLRHLTITKRVHLHNYLGYYWQIYYYYLKHMLYYYFAYYTYTIALNYSNDLSIHSSSFLCFCFSQSDPFDRNHSLFDVSYIWQPYFNIRTITLVPLVWKNYFIRVNAINVKGCAFFSIRIHTVTYINNISH